ncbi:MAG: HD domain-containing protein [Gallionella sp.]|nr:HD domain-containing protein [Gallionella sp.]
MTDNNKSIEGIAQSVVDNAKHYVASVSAMSDSNDLSATEDIMSSSGIKLVARGMRIDANLREKLCGHQLSGATMENSISIAGGITSEALAVDTAHLIDSDAWFKRLEVMSGDPGAMRHGLSRLKLPRAILFRLTVARDQRPALYRHLLSVAVISHYLALRLQLKQVTIDNLLIAALCHDLGELYIDPVILGSGHRVTDEERRFIYAHPIMGWLMVHELQGVDAEVAGTIIQHQERLDGSGYPHGKRDDAIGLPGRILAIADVSASIMARFSDHRRLSTLLRLNSKKYDSKVVGLLHEAIVQEAAPASHAECGSKTMKRLADFVTFLDGWSQLNAMTDSAREVSCEFISERMYNLHMIVRQVGFDPDSLDMLLQLANEDAAIATELTVLVDELQFQIADLGREFDRHAPDWAGTINPLVAVALDDWRKQLQDCLES